MVGPAVSAARDEILSRIRAALADVPSGEEDPVPRAYRVADPDGTLERFVERLRDYGSGVHRAGDGGVAGVVADACRARGVERLVIPAGFPGEWRPGAIELVVDDGLTPRELDAIGAAATASALGIAETGTIVLDGGEGQGRRALSLVPDVHVCVIRAEHVVDGVPAAMRALAAGLRTTRRPVTFVSGPSATADIEFSRVEGVHGPRRFDVVIVV
jgi:L-lactate dehydrogenase complex protein LldG